MIGMKSDMSDTKLLFLSNVSSLFTLETALLLQA